MHYFDKPINPNVWNNHKIFLAYFNITIAKMYSNERRLKLHPEFVLFFGNILNSDMKDGKSIIEINE